MIQWDGPRTDSTVSSHSKMKLTTNDNKCARIARSNNPDGPSSLQLIHSLSIRKDLEARSRLVGFLGYSNFDNPVKVSSKSVVSIITAIRKLKGREEHGDALPSGADLLCLVRFSLCYFVYIILI